MSLKTIKPRVSPMDTKKIAGAVKRIGGRARIRIRERILLRDCYTCRRCGRVDKGSCLEVDHIVPLCLGGAEGDENRQTLCIDCHKEKSAVEDRVRKGGGSNVHSL
jgi:5-methylcytosine-specific restriction protein A